MERLHGDIRDFKINNFELNEKDRKELHRNITIKKQRDEMLEMLQWFVENFEGVFHEGTETNNKVNEAQQLIKQATEL